MARKVKLAPIGDPREVMPWCVKKVGIIIIASTVPEECLLLHRAYSHLLLSVCLQHYKTIIKINTL